MSASATKAAARTNTSRSKAKGAVQEDSRRAAVYARVSLDKTGEHSSVDQQVESAQALIARRGWELVGVYVDNSITGTGKKHRPEFYAMLAAVRCGEVDAIVARHLDRLARNPRERLELVEACREHGVIIALVQGTDMDPTTASGRVVIGVLGEIAEMEIALKSERHVAALERHARAGKVPHGPAPLGYTTAGEVDPDGAAVVRRIYKGFYAGESLRSLARTLTEDGVPTRSGRPWNTRTVRDILTNPRYAGRVKYQGGEMLDDEGRPMRGTWEPLVSDEMFDAIQARLSDPARKTNREGTHRRYLGSSLYICDICEAPIGAINGSQYTCTSGTNGHPTRRRAHIDKFVLDVIEARLRRDDLATLLAPDEESMKPWVEQAERLTARLKVIDADYDTGVIDGQRWRSAKRRVQAELAEVNKKLIGRRHDHALADIASAEDPARAFRDASLMGQRAVIDALAVVRVRNGGKGRLKRDLVTGEEVIDPATVDIQWRR